MKLKIGDLVVIQDECKFKEAVDSFHEKWEKATEARPVLAAAMTTAMGTWAMAMATGSAMSGFRGTATATQGTATVMAVEKQTGKSIRLKYYGYNWEPFDQIVGIIIEIRPEEHSDFDVIKIREQSGGTRYCRRYVLERAQEAI